MLQSSTVSVNILLNDLDNWLELNQRKISIDTKFSLIPETVNGYDMYGAYRIEILNLSDKVNTIHIIDALFGIKVLFNETVNTFKTIKDALKFIKKVFKEDVNIFLKDSVE